MRKLGLALLVAALTGPLSQPTRGAQAPSADAFARDLQQKYDKVRDFSADFVQTYRGGVLRQTATERGRLLVKKPGKMRWEYREPERKLFVSDGRKLYSYVPEDRQVLVTDVPDDDHATTPALFLAGKGNLTRDFTVTYENKVQDAPAGTTVLKLAPRRAEPEYDWLMLAVDPTTLEIRMLITVDAQGGRSTFSLTNLKENVGVADKEFAFSIPRGVEVITDRAAGQ
ncbi:MAG TPA: outer membrane lipoprotein chaperone LolA [Vicinamibacterales bacterium]|jgi:outer membrane lipoprotein carrier protein